MAARPNIVLVTTDHQRFDTIGAAGFAHAVTPNLDRLASRGTLHRSHFAQSSVCVPSRASIVSGHYPHQTGVVWNFSPYPSQLPSIFETLRRSGYTTACIGKHHLVQTKERRHFTHALGDGGKWALYCEPFREHLKKHGLSARAFWQDAEYADSLGALTSDREDHLYVDGWVMDRTLEWLQGEGAREPFCLWVGFYGPHPPYDPPRRFRELYADRDLPPPRRHDREWENKGPLYRIYRSYGGYLFEGHAWPELTPERLRKMRAHYLGEISFVDEQVGRLMDLLESTGLADRTRLLFTSDHGDSQGDHDLVSKGPFLYDELIHVPLITLCPAQAPSVVDGITESVDLAPTMARWAGEPWRGPGRPLGEGSAREATLSQTVTQIALRTATTKIIHTRGRDDADELYDLCGDPGELSNLAADRPEAVEEARRRLLLHVDRLGVGRQPSWHMERTRDPLTGRELEWEFTF